MKSESAHGKPGPARAVLACKPKRATLGTTIAGVQAIVSMTWKSTAPGMGRTATRPILASRD